MVKHTQTIPRQQPTSSIFDHFVGFALKGLTDDYWKYYLCFMSGFEPEVIRLIQRFLC